MIIPPAGQSPRKRVSTDARNGWPIAGPRGDDQALSQAVQYERTLNDLAIRNALLAKPLRRHARQAETLVIHELGLAHARRRIDLVVINGVVHGFEIKSAVDSLGRLPAQLEIYSQSLQKLTMVIADRHVEPVMARLPIWCGIWRAHGGPRGGVHFEVLRRSARNPAVDRYMLAHLLWRDEAQAILEGLGASKATLRAPRAELYRALAKTVTEAQLAALIRTSMARRQAWRGLSKPS